MEQGWQNPSGLPTSSPGWEHVSVIPWKSTTKQRMVFRMIQIKGFPTSNGQSLVFGLHGLFSFNKPWQSRVEPVPPPIPPKKQHPLSSSTDEAFFHQPRLTTFI